MRISKILRLVGGIALCMFVCAALVLGTTIGISCMQNQDFTETFYAVTSSKVKDGLRIIHISDLHDAHYERLVHRVELLDPDIIVFTGDMVSYDTSSITHVVETAGQLVEIAPVFYVYGNHERVRQFGSELLRSDVEHLASQSQVDDEEFRFDQFPDSLREMMEAAGVNVLMNEQTTVEVGDTIVDIFGVLTTSSEGFYRYAEDNFYQYAYADEEHFKLMLIHEPYLMELITGEDWGDMILCGHTHGGIMRLPYIGGVYEDFYGIFPELWSDAKIKGQYSIDGIPMIVSGGLSDEGIWRIGNQPELVVVDINRY